MRRALILAFVLCAQTVFGAAGGPFGTKQSYLLNRMFTGPGYFGFPGEIAAPFTCDSTTERSTYYDTVLHAAYICNGTSWGSLGGVSSPISGAFVATGTWTFGSAADAAGSVRLGETASCIVYEGATANAFESSLCATDPTVGDQTFNLPNLAGATTDTLATLGAAQAFTGVITFGSAADAANSVAIGETANCVTFEGATANTSETRICAGNPTAGDNTYTFPALGAAVSVTVPCLECAQTFTQTNTFSGLTSLPTGASFQVGDNVTIAHSSGSANAYYTPKLTINTPDVGAFGTGSLSNSILLMEATDFGGFDFQNGNCGTSACTDPSLWMFSHNQNTAQWGGFWHDATNFNIKTGTGAVKISNHVMLAGTAPALSACGTSPTTVTGSDGAGHFTVGSAATGCVLTFNAAWSVVPECFVNDQTAILAVLAVPTTTTITFTTTVASAISSQTISYFCIQGS